MFVPSFVLFQGVNLCFSDILLVFCQDQPVAQLETKFSAAAVKAQSIWCRWLTDFMLTSEAWWCFLAKNCNFWLNLIQVNWTKATVNTIWISSGKYNKLLTGIWPKKGKLEMLWDCSKYTTNRQDQDEVKPRKIREFRSLKLWSFPSKFLKTAVCKVCSKITSIVFGMTF